MKPRILLINPPIYDFSAYDFWLKPYHTGNTRRRALPGLDRHGQAAPA
jgi:hypothetical protein